MPPAPEVNQRSEQRMFVSSAAMLRAFPDGVLLVDEAGVVQHTNARAGELLGIDSAALLGQSLAALPGGIVLSQHHTASVGSFELDGRSFSVQCSPLHSDDNQDRVIGSLIVLRDISALVAERHAQYALVARAVHDVRVPLQAMSGTAEGLLRGWFGSVSDEQRGFLEIIKENADRQADLISRLFDLYALTTNYVQLIREHIRIDALINEVVQEWTEHFTSRQLALTVEVPADLPVVYADRRRLRQVVVALLDNACKYTMAGGFVVLSAHLQDSMICIAVRDTGIGIRAADQPMLFTPFFRGEGPLHEGRYGGLSLAIANLSVALHGGQIWFESVEGQGSTFSFSIPINTDPSA